MFAILLRISVACSLLASAVQANEFRVREGTTLNARSGPGTEHQVVTRLLPGTVLHEINRNGSWSRVRLPNSREVWVHNDFINPRARADVTEYWIRTGKRAEARAGPGSRHQLLGHVDSGWKVREFERKGPWSRVDLANGNQVWLANRNLVDTATFTRSKHVDSCVGNDRCRKVLTCNDNETGPSTKRCFSVDVSGIGGRSVASHTVSRIGAVLVGSENIGRYQMRQMCHRSEGRALQANRLPGPRAAVRCSVDSDSRCAGNVAIAYCGQSVEVGDSKCVGQVPGEIRDQIMHASAAIVAGSGRQAEMSVRMLHDWAKADALMINDPPDGDNSVGQWWQKEALGPILLNYSLVRGQAEASARQLIDRWLNRLVYAQNMGSGVASERSGHGSRRYMFGRRGSNYTNHRYLRDLNAMRWGVMVGDDLLFQQGIERYWVALHQMREDGSFPWESSRGYRALAYHNTVLSQLFGMAEVAAAQGYDLYRLRTDDRRSIHTAVEWAVATAENPNHAARYARINQGTGGNPFNGIQDFSFISGTIGWMEIYLARFPDHENSQRLRRLRLADDARAWFGDPRPVKMRGPRGFLERRPLLDSFLGVNATCFWEPRVLP